MALIDPFIKHISNVKVHFKERIAGGSVCVYVCVCVCGGGGCLVPCRPAIYLPVQVKV